MFPTNRERWKRIDGYANYEVSNFGRVSNASTERILKPRDRSGYHTVDLYKNGKRKSYDIHKLVAREWVSNPAEKRCVDHIDGSRTNNHIENLRYATHSENMKNRSKRANTTSKY